VSGHASSAKSNRLRDEGIPLLHGHVHESFRERRTKQGTWGINIGVDWWKYQPVAAETIAQHLECLKHDRATITGPSGTSR
jgi:calcineurin-like phosphoesterase family protein